MTYHQPFRVAHAFLVVALLVLAGQPALASATNLRIGGTGAGLGLMSSLAEAFAAEDEALSIEVEPSLGSSGGIRALTDGAIDIAVSARPLKPKEAEAPLVATPLSRTPIVIASSHRQAEAIAAGDLASLYANPVARWADGTPLRIILRPASDSDSAFLEGSFDGMAAALAEARKRSEVPVATTDQENLALAIDIEGSLTIASLTQIVSEEAPLVVIPLNGVAPTLANLEAGRYPFYKELVIVVRQDRGAAVDRFISFIASERGRQILRDTGNLPLL
jgi:phosphate transport system substrate-binding protein